MEKAARKAEVKADVDILDMASDDDCAETKSSVGEREEVRKKGLRNVVSSSIGWMLTSYQG